MTNRLQFLRVLIGLIVPIHFSFAAYDHFKGAEQPKESSQFNLEEKGVQQICEVYSNFAIITLDDSSSAGVENLAIRPISRTTQMQKICQKDYPGKEVTLKGVDGYPWGVLGEYLFVRGSDSFGGFLGIQIFHTRSGKKVFSTVVNDHQPYHFGKNHSGRVKLSYITRLNLHCVPRAQNPQCWSKTLKENQVPETVEITPPNCASVFKDAPSALKDPKTILVGVPVEVSDLARPRILYVAGKSICQLAPE